MPKSMRQCFIRVSQNCETEQGLKTYTYDYLKNLINDWSLKTDLLYFMIYHNDDENNLHTHIVLKFSAPQPFSNLKKKIPYGRIESAKNINSCIQYLTHINQPDKKQYSRDDIYTNCKDLSPFFVSTQSQEKITIQKILDDIKISKITEYNQYSTIPIEIWSKYKNQIQNAFVYMRGVKTMDNNRNISVYFVEGLAGTGKTTYCKQWCKKNDYSYSISSSSNDVLQDYQGQDVLILDDLRDSIFSLSDFLKLLDNHTQSSVKSRFANKFFTGHTIFITSAKPLSDWYQNCSENRLQLYRRINNLMQFDKNKIRIFDFNGQTFIFSYSVKNNICENIVKIEKSKKALFDDETEFIDTKDIEQLKLIEGFIPCSDDFIVDNE